MSEEERRKQFLIELRELTMKHGIAIGGCCNFDCPYLEMNADVSKGAGYIHEDGTLVEWISPKYGAYRFYSKDIVLPENGEQG